MLLVRDGKRTTAAQRVAARAAQERRLRPPPRAARPRRFPADDRRADHDDPRRRRPRRSRPVRRATDEVLGLVRRRHPLGGDRLVRLPARLGRRDQPARADAHRHTARRARCRAAPRRRVDLLRGRQPPRQRARGAGVGGPVRPRAELARPRSPPPAGCAATARRPAASPISSPASAPRPAASSAPPAPRRWPPRPSSCASAGCATSSSRPAGPGRRASAGPTPTPSPRRSASRRSSTRRGDVPVSIVRPSIIESAWAEPRPGWIRGFRMAEPVILSVRPRPAARVPRRSRGHRRRHPRRPRRRRHHHRRRPRPGRRAADQPGRLGRHQPAEVPDARRQRQRLVHRAPALRRRRPADRRAGVALPGAWPGAGAAAAGPRQ